MTSGPHFFITTPALSERGATLSGQGTPAPAMRTARSSERGPASGSS